MKILFLGDYSNLHSCLSAQLRLDGLDTTVVSDGGGHMRNKVDRLLVRKPGKTGTLRYAASIAALLPKMRGYDVVQINNTQFLNLRPEKLWWIFKYLKKHNGSVFMTLMGNDVNFVDRCINTDMFRFSEFRAGTQPTINSLRHPEHETGWTTSAMLDYCHRLFDSLDGAVSILPEYDMAARSLLGDRLAFANIPVDLGTLPYSPVEPRDGKIRILVGMRPGQIDSKGTDILLDLCREIESEMPGRCEVKNVYGLTLKQYIEELKQAHIVIDQLYSYSPGTNGLQTMALGRIPATGGQPEFYSYIGEPQWAENPAAGPILSLSPLDTDMKERITALIEDPDRMRQMSIDGRRLVEKNNDSAIVAKKFTAHWNRLCR